MSRTRFRLVVDPIACDGAGVCAELLPELISLDPWGFPSSPLATCRPDSSITLAGPSPAAPGWH
jgi:ferredoxin